jgi:hypothetical protein
MIRCWAGSSERSGERAGEGRRIPGPRCGGHTAERPTAVEDDFRDQRITRCLELYRTGRLPI